MLKTTMWRVHVKLVRRTPLPVFPVVQPLSAHSPYEAPDPPNGDRILTSLIFADPHFGFLKAIRNARLTPFHDRRALDLMVQLAALLQPDRIDILGNILDLAEWSSKFRKSPEFYWTTQPALCEGFWWLEQLCQAAPDAMITVFEGNHDARMPGAVADHLPAAYDLKPGPVTDGWPVLSVPYLLGLDSLGIRWVGGYPDANDWLNEGLELGHGATARKKPGDTTKAEAQGSDLDRIIGHIHRREASSRTRWLWGNRAETVTAWCPGCVCRIDGIVPGRTGRQQWQQGALRAQYVPEGRHRTMTLLPVEEGQFVVDGVLLRARDRLPEIASCFPDLNWGAAPA